MNNMGFRCPACSTDFGHEREALKEHLKACELGRVVVSVRDKNDNTGAVLSELRDALALIRGNDDGAVVTA
jgi:hypothetical protein